MSNLVNPYRFGTPTPTPTPTLPDPTNVVYWFAADHGAYSDAGASIACANNDPVYHWANQGVASDHGVQATLANRPIFKTGGLNGLPYLDCNGTSHCFDDLQEGDQPSGISTFNAYTIFVVVDAVDITADGRWLFGSPSTAATFSVKCGFWWRNNSGAIEYAWGKSNTSSVIPNKSGLVAGPNVLAGRVQGGVTSSTFGRGNQSSAMTGFSQSTNSNSDANTAMRFLRHGTTPAGFFLGRLYEVIYYNKEVSNANCNTVIDYLKTKYGIS